ncbi:MAG: 2-succinyl-5-enolpyruvyl-6-hydroxy-3-cyclohexene-1-carboxylic-acid synthase, partial [Bacteroidetes bacterium]|nr:2-succinyl-5-enolpyruvyl-6-hydroxy-3-cyclohexene-1-carboxylic-acid synthase [Bacteroidota bacterium]
SIVDERSAGFFALGLAQQTNKTVALVCTSGSATLNYAPAIAEAFYQHISLLVLTADRPVEWVDQADSQTIRQKNIFENYIRKSFELPQHLSTNDDVWFADRLICEAIDRCQQPVSGPVHINLPASEPLYEGFDDQILKPKIISTSEVQLSLKDDQLKKLAKAWNSHTKKLIICGMLAPNDALNKLLTFISDDPSVIVLTESTSNLYHSNFNSCIDRTLSSITEDEIGKFKPKLLISIGNQIISKKIKAFFREHRPEEHWHIDSSDLFLDTFQSLTQNIPLHPLQFFEGLKPHILFKESNFANIWQQRNEWVKQKHHAILENCEYTDLKVIDELLKAIPLNSNLQMGNSTPVRYAQLFDNRKDLTYNCNRGTSGIDGSLSTAVGASIGNKIPTTIILGDLSFFYDSNGLWNNYLNQGLKVIIINNRGGGIFRFLDGPSNTEAFEEFFEATHQLNAEGIAKSFNVSYQKAMSSKELSERLTELYHPNNNKTCILEIFTPREKNAEVLKDYFKQLL